MSSPVIPPPRGEDLEALRAAITPTADPTDRFTAFTPTDRDGVRRDVPASVPVRDLPRDGGPRKDTWESMIEEQPVAAPGPSRSHGHIAAGLGIDHDSVLARERDKFGGIKIGSAFFGWVAAAGIAVLLTSLLTAAGVVLSLTSKTSATDITRQAAAGTGAAKTVGLVGAILLLVVLFLAYYSGGYVAARMARFDGAQQGLAVWLWGIVFAIVIFVLVKIAGSKYNILTNLNLPRIPVDEGALSTAAIAAIAAIIVVTLGAAVLGGLAGMRFHRKVDKAGLSV